MLEDRCLPATITVTNPSDLIAPGVSLREAIQAANTNAAVNEANAGDAGADVIRFDPSLADQTIVLTGGELTITEDLTITGLGAARLSISGNDDFRILNVSAGVTAAVSSLTLEGGHASRGGAVFNDGILTLTGLVIRDSVAHGQGGSGSSGGQGGFGGGIFNSGTLTMVTGTVRDNRAVGGTGANGSFAGSGGGAGGGGGIFNDFGATLTLQCSTLSGNAARGGRGGNGGFGTFGAGGAGMGGAIFNAADTTGSGVVVIDTSTLSGNTAARDGGGLSNDSSLMVSNCTLSGNRAGGDGGGLYNDGELTLMSSTVTQNRADADGDEFGSGGGLYVTDHAAGRLTVLHNTIMAGNFRGACTAADDVNGGASRDSSSNLIGNAMGAAGFDPRLGNLLDVNPHLGPLADNGGPTLTHALLFGSPAIDAGNNDMTTMTTDQRGLARMIELLGHGPKTDIGAIELAVFPPPPPPPPHQHRAARVVFLPVGPRRLGPHGLSAGLLLPLVQVFEAGSRELLFEVLLRGLAFRGGVRLAVGDFNGDRTDDVILVSAGLGRPVKVRILDGRNGGMLGSFTAFPRKFGPLEVRVVDRNHDGRP